MSEELPEKCCGNCKYWTPHRPDGCPGNCDYPVDIKAIPESLVWFTVNDRDGTDCPCFEAKENV